MGIWSLPISRVLLYYSFFFFFFCHGFFLHLSYNTPSCISFILHGTSAILLLYVLAIILFTLLVRDASLYFVPRRQLQDAH